MRFLTTTSLLGLSCFIAQQFFQFWIIIVIAFLFGYVANIKGLKAFLAGFIAVGILWGLKAYVIDHSTDAILTDKIAAIFTVESTVLIVITGVLGGILGGMGTLSGRLFKNLIA